MKDEEFEWDDQKAADNYAKHGVPFETQLSLRPGRENPLPGDKAQLNPAGSLPA